MAADLIIFAVFIFIKAAVQFSKFVFVFSILLEILILMAFISLAKS